MTFVIRPSVFFWVFFANTDDNKVVCHGSLKSGKRSFGRFSRPLLEVYFQTSFRYEPKVKSLAVAEIFRYCKGFRLSYSYFCLLDQKYKRGVLSVAFDKHGSICSWETTPYPFAVLASRRSEKYDPRSGEQMPCVELEHIEQETGRIIVAFHRHNKAVLKVSVSPGILSLGSYALIWGSTLLWRKTWCVPLKYGP